MSTPVETNYRVVVHERDTDESDDRRVWIMLDLSGLPIEAKGHRFTSAWGDGTVSGHMTLNSDYPVLYFSGNNTGPCGNCDTYPSLEFFDDAEHGARVVYKGGSCPASGGVVWCTDLAVPSGKMVVADSLRPVLDVPLREGRDVPGYNSIAGQKLHSEDQAAAGVAYGAASNIALGLYRDPTKGPDSYAIVTADDEAEPGEDGYYAGEQIARICTDLWAYSLTDFDHFVARARDLVASEGYAEDHRYDGWTVTGWLADGADPAALPEDFKAVEVMPGTYRFTHHGGTIKGADGDFHDQPWPLVWAEVELLD